MVEHVRDGLNKTLMSTATAMLGTITFVGILVIIVDSGVLLRTPTRRGMIAMTQQLNRNSNNPELNVRIEINLV